MTITVKTQVDGDVKNAVCQNLSHYRSVLKQTGDVLSPIMRSVGQISFHPVLQSFFSEIKVKCDSLNDVLGRITRALDDNRLPKDETIKRRIFSWYDSCKAWLHDSRGFIQKIYPIIRDYKGGYIHDNDLHSIVALHSALFAMHGSLSNEILGVVDDVEITECEIYKVFDKIRKCYREDEDRFAWNVCGSCYKRVYCAKGFEVVPLNLYSNALKYLPDGYKKSDKRNITVAFSDEDDNFIVRVASIGPFVPENEIDSLWDIGVRASSADLASTEGTGRGLPTVKRLCTQSGFLAKITSVHRPEDDDGWGLFTVSIFVPRSAYVDNSSNDGLQGLQDGKLMSLK